MNGGVPWLVLLALLGAVGVAWRWGHLARREPPMPPGQASRSPRRWRARTPDDCPACRVQGSAPPTAAPPPLPPPWRDGKSRRGAPRRIATAGYACPTPACPYYGITDERLHALVGDGHHGATDRIQDFRCQACGTKVSARWGTALYRLKTPPQRVVLLSDTVGNSISA